MTTKSFGDEQKTEKSLPESLHDSRSRRGELNLAISFFLVRHTCSSVLDQEDPMSLFQTFHGPGSRDPLVLSSSKADDVSKSVQGRATPVSSPWSLAFANPSPFVTC